MKRVMAVTAATIMAIGASAYLSCTDIHAAADTESFEYSEIVSENEDFPADELTTDEEENTGIKGDVNNDGKINVTDVVKTAAEIKGVAKLDTDCMWRADVNNDGRVDVTDLSKLVWAVSGKDESRKPAVPEKNEKHEINSPISSQTNIYENAVGTRLADFYSSNYNLYGWPTGQCTWYCIGRAKEKLGADMPAKGLTGNAINWYYNAQRINPASVGTEIKSDCVCVCSSWTHGYGHVVYIEYVDPDTGAIYFSQANRLGWATNYADNGKIEKADSYADFVAQMNWLYLTPVGFVYPDRM